MSGTVLISRAGDEAAKERAKQLVADYDIELWHLDRKIAVFYAKA